MILGLVSFFTMISNQIDGFLFTLDIADNYFLGK